MSDEGMLVRKVTEDSFRMKPVCTDVVGSARLKLPMIRCNISFHFIFLHSFSFLDE